MSKFKNPVIQGFYPDPSVCRVGEDFFLVTSSMEYFPGIPLFHSKDLINWEQIGHVLNRPEQLDLDESKPSGGIMAATIRYHRGTFYVSCNTEKGHFVCKTDDPYGEWSNPYFLRNDGIDASLFFDDDGKAYFTANHIPPGGEKYKGDKEIWIQEFDESSMKLTCEPVGLWSGTGGLYPEAPHIYKVDGFYYLLIAEGTTFHCHAVTIARSRNVFGPYISNPQNPILTHRHLSREYPITNVGHADMFQIPNGDWWAVALGSRHCGGYYEPEVDKSGGYYRNIGRETYLFPVKWELGWPVFCPDTGKIELAYDKPDLPENSPLLPLSCDNFESDKLNVCFATIRTPREPFYSLKERPGFLRLQLRSQTIEEIAHLSFIGRRQQHFHFSAATAMEFIPRGDNEQAGLVVLSDNKNLFKLLVGKSNDNFTVTLFMVDDGMQRILKKCLIPKPPDNRIYLKAAAHNLDYAFYFSSRPGEWIPLCENADGRILCLEYLYQYRHTGVFIGMYATSDGRVSSNYADFDWFEYVGT